MLCIMLETELGHPACLSGFCKCLIIPLGWVVNENSNTSSLFQIGEMGDVIRYLCSNSVYLEACTKPCFFKHKRNQKKKKKAHFPTLYSKCPLVNTPTQNWCQYFAKTTQLSDSVQTFFCFWELCYSLYTLAFFFPLQQQTCSPHPWNNIQPRHCGAEQLNP